MGTDTGWQFEYWPSQCCSKVFYLSLSKPSDQLFPCFLQVYLEQCQQPMQQSLHLLWGRQLHRYSFLTPSSILCIHVTLCTLKQQAMLLIETVAGTSIDHFLSNHFVGNGTFPSGFPSQESQNAAHCSQSSWSEEQPQESPSTWDTAACVGSKVTSHNIKLICLNSQWRCSDNLWLLSLSVFCPSPSWHPQLSCFVRSVIQNLKISSLF